MTGARPYWTGQEAFDACRAEMVVARDEVREMAHQAAGDLAGDERNPVKHAVRDALVQAVRHLDDGLERLTPLFGVESLYGPDGPELRDTDSPPATERQLDRVAANRGRSFGGRTARRAAS